MDYLTKKDPHMPSLPAAIIRKAASCKTVTAYLLLALTAFYCSFQPLIRLGLPVSHDIGFHLFQADQFASALFSGTMIPHWAAGSNQGYGSPNFIFYSPLSYNFAALMNWGVGSTHISLIISIWFSFFFSGIAMFTAAARLSGREGGLFAAILYQILPFHLIDLYARGSFAELFAFVWFPLIILCAHGTFGSERKKRYVLGLSLTYAALILTHLASAYIFSFVLGAYLLFNYLSQKDGKAFALALFAVAAGLGLSAFYLVPAMFEREFVNIEFIVKCFVGDYRQNFLFSSQFLKQGLLDFRRIVHVVTVLDCLLFLSLALVLSAKRETARRVSPHSFFIALFLFALFVTTPLSGPIWEFVPGFATLQFPWRWITMMELSLCFLLAASISAADVCAWVKPKARTRALYYSLATVMILSLMIIARSNETYSKDYAGYGVAREYTPLVVKNLNKLVAIKQEQVSILSGAASAAIRQWSPEYRVVAVDASAAALLRIKTTYYPGWQAEIDGREAPIGIQNESGAMLIGMPHGVHTLTLRFVDTPLRRFSKYLSLLSLATLLIWGGFNRRRLAWI